MIVHEKQKRRKCVSNSNTFRFLSNAYSDSDKVAGESMHVCDLEYNYYYKAASTSTTSSNGGNVELKSIKTSVSKSTNGGKQSGGK